MTHTLTWLPTLGLSVLLTIGAAGHGAQMQSAEVRAHLGRPMVFVAGKPQPLPSYCPIGWNKRWFMQLMPRFYPHKMGAYYLMAPVLHTDLHGTPFWDGDRVSNQPLFSEPERKMQGFTSLDESAEHVLAHDPGAYVIMRMGICEPKTWRTLHPQEYFITDDGTQGPAPSLASDRYWDTAARFCTAFVQHCESRPWAHRIIGYVNLFRTEGTSQSIIEGWLYDHNPLMVQRWRAYLKKTYGTVKRLREAYGDPTLTFRTIDVPRDKLRGLHRDVDNLLYWQHAKDNRVLRDYLLLQRDLFHQRFGQICKAMRAGTVRKRFFVYDALKQTMLGWNCGDFFYRGLSRQPDRPDLMAAGGSMNAADLLGSPAFDGLLTPHDYQARAIGGVFEPEGIVDSAVLRGKVFICEMDMRTYHAQRERLYGKARNLREFEAISWRNIATGLTRGFYNYYMDLYADWYGPPEIQKVIARQVDVLKQSVDWPHRTVPGIAMILDDTSVLETNGSGRFLHDAVMWEQKMGLARCGVPHRIYLFEDLALDSFPNHRVYYFPNLFRVDDARLALLKKKVFRDGHVVVWGPGSGISDGTTIGPASATRLTGFQFDMLNVNFPRRTLVSDFIHPITRALRADCVIGGPLSYGPVLFPTDGHALGLAWTKNGADQCGLAVKEFGKGALRKPGGGAERGAGDYAAVFTTAVPLPADLWRGLSRYAGAHVYCDTNDILLADSTIVALHSLQSGPKRIALPRACTVTDLVTGKRLHPRTPEIRFDLVGPETRVFLVEGISNEKAP